MDQMKKISGQSRLVSEELKQQIAPLFQKMRRTVVLHAVLDFEDEKSLELGSFLKAINCEVNLCIIWKYIGEYV